MEGDEIQCKITFVGESSVGKTSLIQQYVNNIFDPNYLTTIGGDQLLKPYIIDGKKINLNIWDTAGQERFRSINKIFLKNSKIVILVYDITKKETYEKIVDYWYPRICDVLGDDIIVGLAGNKCDLYEKENISVDEVKKFANSNNMIFKETTATSFDTIDSLINELVEAFCNKFKDNIVQNGVALSDKNVGDFKKKGCCQNSKMS